MSTEKTPHVTEKESLQVAEAARQTEWVQPSFMRELFLGNFRKDLLYPYPLPSEDRPEFTDFYEKLEHFLAHDVDAAAIDRTGEYPQHVLDGLRRLGAFGIKIPKEYGGLGLNHVEYGRVMTLLGSKCGAHTFPYLDVKNESAIVEHEASTSKISDDQVFYCRQRGLSPEDAVNLIVNGFCKDVFRELPMEFAVEAQKLLAVSLEGSVG